MEQPKFFKTQLLLRKWFEKNHDKQQELWVGFYKVNSGMPTVSYKQAVDEALCFGWIDGIRKGIDDKAYKNRFTPRKKGSTWSQVNIKRVGELKKEGRMHPAGLKVFEERDQRKTNLYSFEQDKIKFDPAQEKLFIKNKKAWKFFTSQPAGYRKISTWWVISAKREETKLKRLNTLITDSENETRINLLAR